MSRRRSSTPELIVISWRDIPAQINAGAGRDKHQHMLSPRFQHAIDRAAGVAGLTGTDDYVQEWRRSTTPLAADADPARAGEAEATRIETQYDRDRLEALVANGGLDPSEPPAEEAP